MFFACLNSDIQVTKNWLAAYNSNFLKTIENTAIIQPKIIRLQTKRLLLNMQVLLVVLLINMATPIVEVRIFDTLRKG